MTRAGRSVAGVTLVELMVVLVIIAVVAALAVQGAARGDRTAKIARQALNLTWAARREALAMGTLVYGTASAYDGTPRAPCMPNTQLVITARSIRQYNCLGLDDAVAPNELPCTAVNDDCTWQDPVRDLDVPTDVVIAYVESQNVDTGVKTKVALGSNEARVYYRPDGNSDACVDCAVDNGLGNPQEWLTLYLRPVQIADETECETEDGRCFMVLPQSRRATKWSP